MRLPFSHVVHVYCLVMAARRPIVRAVLIIVCVLALVVVALGLWVVRLARAVPEYYHPMPASSENAAAAESVEHVLAREISRVRPAAADSKATRGSYESERWEVNLSEEDLNAWLSLRLPEWLRSRGTTLPAGFTDPVIECVDGALILAATWDSPIGKVVISQPISIVNGHELVLDGPVVGDLPAPAVFQEAIEAVLGRVKAGLTMQAGRVKLERIGLEDGRAVRIETIRADANGLVLVCRTVR